MQQILTRDTDAIEFVTGLLAVWSVDGGRVPFPFTMDAIEAVVDKLVGDIEELTPREVIRAFDAILRAADFDIDEGELSEIDRDYALANLPELGEE